MFILFEQVLAQPRKQKSQQHLEEVIVMRMTMTMTEATRAAALAADGKSICGHLAN